jgi:hypothetical protein
MLCAEFEQHARLHPADAAASLKRLAQYSGFSQSDDEMYRKDLRESSYRALLPVLQEVSPEHVPLAREGERRGSHDEVLDWW